MRRNSSNKTGRFLKYVLGGLLIVFLVACSISAVINLSLPKHSKVVDHLVSIEKARLAEFFHLKQTLGSVVWPGLGEADIPVIVYNEEYAFIIGYPDPPAGWLKVPQREARGGPWEAVPDDKFDGQSYYRQHLTDPNKTPEGFTVLVGDHWVATFQTKEYSEISFYTGFREKLPPVIREVFPYRLFWDNLADDSEAYIAFLLHEAFHAYQGIVNPDRFAEAEFVIRLESQYPWDETTQRKAWQEELNLLVDATKATTDEEAAELARQFLTQRNARRAQPGLRSELVVFERQREWLEGLAKYAELTIGRTAVSTPGYKPLPDLNDDPDFNAYSTRERFWSMQLDQVRRIQNNEGEIRFYYSGFAQAVVLDRLLPGWKKQALSEGIWLEDLLREAISQP